VGTEGGDKCVDNVDKLRKKWCGGEKGRIRKRSATSGGGNSSRGSADPRESLRKRRISKLALSARKVLPPPDVADRFRILFFTWGRGEADCGWKEEV
jgi:hypothetical protein